MDTNFIASHIQCTQEEKQCCMETAEKILTLVQVARSQGLLALESLSNLARYRSPSLLQLGIFLIVDGTDPSIVKEILENYLISSRLANKEFLEHMIICKGILSMQQGDNPEQIREIICSLFGLDFREQFSAYFMQAPNPKELSQLLDENASLLNSFPKTTLLDLYGDLDDRSIQRIIYELSSLDLEYGLAGSSQKVMSLFLNNMSKQRQQRFFQDIKTFHSLELRDIDQCQRRIKAVIDQLAQQGEILIMPLSCNRLTNEEICTLLTPPSKNENQPAAPPNAHVL